MSRRTTMEEEINDSTLDQKNIEIFPGSPKETTSKAVLELRNIRKYFPIKNQSLLFSQVIGMIKAVDGIDLQLFKGEVLGLVGESGCGKSTLTKVIVGLDEPTTGEVWYRDINFYDSKNKQERMKYHKNVQMVFQDPSNSLNPRRLVKDILREPLIIHNKNLTPDEQIQKVNELLSIVGLEQYHGDRYPHEFSGGQKQRIGLARSLIMNPEIILADEPVSALDVSVQASILNLMLDLQEKFGLTMVFIAHDLSVVRHVSNRVAVMYLGRIVEIGPTDKILIRPTHPYTVSLLSSIPFPDPDITKKQIILEGDVPSPANLPSGCRFHPRCYKAEQKCKDQEPLLEEKRNGIWSACHFPEDEEIIKFEVINGE
jgi:oligopeptide transport system ATP-binding protein